MFTADVRVQVPPRPPEKKVHICVPSFFIEKGRGEELKEKCSENEAYDQRCYANQSIFQRISEIFYPYNFSNYGFLNDLFYNLINFFDHVQYNWRLLIDRFAPCGQIFDFSIQNIRQFDQMERVWTALIIFPFADRLARYGQGLRELPLRQVFLIS